MRPGRSSTDPDVLSCRARSTGRAASAWFSASRLPGFQIASQSRGDKVHDVVDRSGRERLETHGIPKDGDTHHVLANARSVNLVAPAVGLEPTTKRLTAARSTTELRRSE